MPELRRCARRAQRLAKAFRLLDQMIGRQHQQQRFGIPARGIQCRDGHRRRRVAAGGLQQDAGRFAADLAQLFGHQEAVLLVAHDQRRGQLRHAHQSEQGVLQQGVLGTQGQALLGQLLARQGPEPGARASGQDHGHHAGCGGKRVDGQGYRCSAHGECSGMAENCRPNCRRRSRSRQGMGNRASKGIRLLPLPMRTMARGRGAVTAR